VAAGRNESFDDRKADRFYWVKPVSRRANYPDAYVAGRAQDQDKRDYTCPDPGPCLV